MLKKYSVRPAPPGHVCRERGEVIHMYHNDVRSYSLGGGDININERDRLHWAQLRR